MIESYCMVQLAELFGLELSSKAAARQAAQAEQQAAIEAAAAAAAAAEAPVKGKGDKRKTAKKDDIKSISATAAGVKEATESAPVVPVRYSIDLCSR